MHDASENENAMPSWINWAEAERSGAVMAFSAEIGHKLEPLFSKFYDDPSQIGAEIEQVADILQERGGRVLPCVQPKKGRRCDDILSIFQNVYFQNSPCTSKFLNLSIMHHWQAYKHLENILSGTFFKNWEHVWCKELQTYLAALGHQYNLGMAHQCRNCAYCLS